MEKTGKRHAFLHSKNYQVDTPCPLQTMLSSERKKKKLQLLNESVNLLVEKLIVWFKRLKCEV